MLGSFLTAFCGQCTNGVEVMCCILNLDPPFSSPSCTVCVKSICSALTEIVVSQQEGASLVQIKLGVHWMVLLIQCTCMYICTMQVLETGMCGRNIKLNSETSAFHMQNYVYG